MNKMNMLTTSSEGPASTREVAWLAGNPISPLEMMVDTLFLETPMKTMKMMGLMKEQTMKMSKNSRGQPNSSLRSLRSFQNHRIG